MRSGSAPGRHGLTPQQESDRADRATARANYYLTVDLYNQLKASKGRGKGKGKQRSWDQMSRHERWWLQQYWEGHLRRAMDEAEAECHRVQAGHFPYTSDERTPAI